MMGNWADVRSTSGRLVARIDGERRLLEIVRNGETALVDLDQYLGRTTVGVFFGGAVSVIGEELEELGTADAAQ